MTSVATIKEDEDIVADDAAKEDSETETESCVGISIGVEADTVASSSRRTGVEELEFVRRHLLD